MVGLSKVVAAALAALTLGGQPAAATTFTGSFYDYQIGLTESLFIRTKTIQWLTIFSDCYSRYTIIKKTFDRTPVNFDYILYRLNQKGPRCAYRYIALYYSQYPASADFVWSVAGFPDLATFKKFDGRDVLLGKRQPPKTVLFAPKTSTIFYTS